jgi:hypothetical protein
VKFRAVRVPPGGGPTDIAKALKIGRASVYRVLGPLADEAHPNGNPSLTGRAKAGAGTEVIPSGKCDGRTESTYRRTLQFCQD